MAVIPKMRVKTAHSEYVIDQNAGTYTRTRVHEKANDLSHAGIHDGEPIEYHKIYAGPAVGSSLVIVHPDGTWVTSTIVQSVESLEEAA